MRGVLRNASSNPSNDDHFPGLDSPSGVVAPVQSPDDRDADDVRDIPQDSEPVDGTIQIGIRAFRVGLLWARHDAYIHIPAMMLFGEQAFLAVGGAPGFNDLSLTFSLIAGVGFTASVPGRTGISWGTEALYLHDLTSRRPSGLSAGHVVFTAGIGFRP